MVAWEFWNEADALADGESAWDFAAAQKVACLGFKAGNPAANVLYTSCCVFPPNPFTDLVMQNGAGGYFDYWVRNVKVYYQKE